MVYTGCKLLSLQELVMQRQRGNAMKVTTPKAVRRNNLHAERSVKSLAYFVG